ncbi:TPR repeat protein [Acidovorax sp. 56]|nr:TPR repeat protein [Acidovorax sp. 56]
MSEPHHLSLALPTKLLCIATLGLGLCSPVVALAAVRGFSESADQGLDPETLHAPSPSAATNRPLRTEQALQALRAAALGSGPAPAASKRPSTNSSPKPTTSPAEAAWLLGLLCLHGVGTPTDTAQAQHWFEQAQALRHPLAPAGLAWCQIMGCLSPPNPAAAIPWIQQLTKGTPGLAKYLEWLVSQAIAPMASPTSEPAQAPHPLLLAAANAGNAQATNELGLEYLATGQLEKALAQFQSAATRSAASAANAHLLRKRIQPSSSKQPHQPIRNNAQAWYTEAQRYHRGDGVPANYAEAVRLYQIAASSGDEKARRMLELIFSRPTPTGTVDLAWMQQLAALNPDSNGSTQNATTPLSPHSWQRDPSPLYGLIPAQWLATRTTSTP